MKKSVEFICICALLLSLPFCAFAEEAQQKEAPYLKSISFKNAAIYEEFSPYTYEYTITLDDTKVTPTLEAYEIEGDANIFMTYSYDEAKHQTGAVVTLEYENGSSIYSFAYRNAEFFEKSGNNYLRDVSCNLGIVYPAINEDTTKYTLYIPNDLTVLDISAATQDVGAYCETPKEVSLTTDQELDLSLVVTASNGEKRIYSFAVKRVDKTSEEMAAIIKSGNTDIVVKSERFYQKPAFLISVLGAAGGLLLVYLLVKITKRLTVEVGDADEVEFFNIEE